jgi:hypothetical protein
VEWLLAIWEVILERSVYFDVFDGSGWPELSELEPFFLTQKGHEWSYKGGNDSWGLDAQGLYGTQNLPRQDRVNVHLYMIGSPVHGVFLQYSKWDGRIKKKDTYYSKGDLGRLREFVRSLHGTPLAVGLFIPFVDAWKAVKEFIETDAELPKSIQWVASEDLPPETFPDP